MYVLERLTYQGENQCPKYRWRQYAVCGSRGLLDRVRTSQRHPENWRVVFSPGPRNLLSQERMQDRRKAG